MTGGCCSTPITEVSQLVPLLSQQFKTLIFFVITVIIRYAVSHVPIILSVHIYTQVLCSEPVGLDSACNAIRFFITAIFTKPHRLPFFRQSHISMRASVQTRTFASSSDISVILTIYIFQTPGIQVTAPTSGDLSSVLFNSHSYGDSLPTLPSFRPHFCRLSEYQGRHFRTLLHHSTYRIISSMKLSFAAPFNPRIVTASRLTFSVRNVSHDNQYRARHKAVFAHSFRHPFLRLSREAHEHHRCEPF